MFTGTLFPSHQVPTVECGQYKDSVADSDCHYVRFVFHPDHIALSHVNLSALKSMAVQLTEYVKKAELATLTAAHPAAAAKADSLAASSGKERDDVKGDLWDDARRSKASELLRYCHKCGIVTSHHVDAQGDECGNCHRFHQFMG